MIRVAPTVAHYAVADPNRVLAKRDGPRLGANPTTLYQLRILKLLEIPQNIYLQNDLKELLRQIYGDESRSLQHICER